MEDFNLDDLINSDYIIPIAVFIIGICIYLGYTYYIKQTDIKEINNNIKKEKENLQKEQVKVEFNDEFIETDGFMGEKEGYIFKTGEKGTGYYLDK